MVPVIEPEDIETALELTSYNYVRWYEAGDVRTIRFQRLTHIPTMEGGDGVSVRRVLQDVRVSRPHVNLGTINGKRIACGEDVLLAAHVPVVNWKDLDAHIQSLIAMLKIEERRYRRIITRDPFGADVGVLPSPQWMPKYQFVVAASDEAAVDRMLIMGNLLRG